MSISEQTITFQPAGAASPRALPAAPIAAGPGVFVTMVLALAMTALPVFFHLAGAPIAIVLSVLLGGIIAAFAAPVVPAALIFAYLFQNFFVALVSPQLTEMDDFNSARAYNFLLTIVAWFALSAAYWLQRGRYDRQFRRMMNVTTICLIAIGVYFGLGMVTSQPGAIIYLRNIAAPFLLLQIFAIVAYRYRVPMAGPLIVIGLAAAVFGYLELFGQDAFFRLINGDAYLEMRLKETFDTGTWVNEMQQSGFVLRGYLDLLRIEFLNSPIFSDLGIQVNRLVGPNFHSISFAYALAFLCIALTAGRHWWFGIVALPLLLVIGSKGSLILVMLVIAALIVSRFFKGFGLLALFAAILVVYSAIGIAVGIGIGDYHVIGLIGGLKGFVANPLGHGIGAGGNLSVDATQINWTLFQHVGETDIALESAVGVLLYQMGVAGLVLLGVLIWLALELWRLQMRSHDRLLAAGALALLAILANGLFQEEALFAPLALGLITALAGLLLGRAYRAAPSPAPAVSRPRGAMR